MIILTRPEAADYLNVSKAIMKSMIANNWLTYHKTPGGHYRFKKTDLDYYLQNHYKKEWASK